MRFHIDSDSGSRIVGWVLPDNPTATPRVRVFLGDEEHTTIEAKHPRPRIKESGLHGTGVCGFVLDEKNCKGIARAPTLRIYDDDSDVLIYRRRPKAHLVDEKLFRIETQLLRASGLNDVLAPFFQLSYAGVELLGQETILSIIGITFSKSILAAGGIYFRTYEHHLRDRGFKTAILLRDPFEELAERLLILKWSATPQGMDAGAYLGQTVADAVHALREVDLESPRDLVAAFDSMDENAQRVVFNTTTRQLACAAADEPIEEYAVSRALDSLAELDIVGVRSDVRGFLDLCAAVLGVEQRIPDAALRVYPSVRGLADQLRQSPEAAERIALDVQLYDATLEAMSVVAGPRAGGPVRDIEASRT
jgi:hypothetical protein